MLSNRSTTSGCVGMVIEGHVCNKDGEERVVLGVGAGDNATGKEVCGQALDNQGNTRAHARWDPHQRTVGRPRGDVEWVATVGTAGSTLGRAMPRWRGSEPDKEVVRRSRHKGPTAQVRWQPQQ